MIVESIASENSTTCDFGNIRALQTLQQELQSLENFSASISKLDQLIEKVLSVRELAQVFQATKGHKLLQSSDNILTLVQFFLKEGLPELIEIIGREINLQQQSVDDTQYRQYSSVEVNSELF